MNTEDRDAIFRKEKAEMIKEMNAYEAALAKHEVRKLDRIIESARRARRSDAEKVAAAEAAIAKLDRRREALGGGNTQ